MNSKDKPFHVIVVGAGIIGSAIAFQLASRGAQVTVVDAGQPGQGASAVSFAWINAREKNPRHYHDLNRRSLDMWDRFARQLGQDVGLTWGGELRWAATPEGSDALHRRVATLQSWGYPIWMLSKGEIEQSEPALSTGSVAAASYTAVDGHVDTGKVIKACLAGAEGRGAQLLPESRVTRLTLAPAESGQTQVQSVVINGQTLAADAVVLAGGPDMPELAAMAGLDLPLYHTFGATLLTEPTGPIFGRAAIVHSEPDSALQIAMRQLPDGTIMIHGGEAGTASRSLGETDEEVQRMMSTAATLAPALQGINIKEVRRGRRPIPQDGHPIIGFALAVPNLYLAVMHSGVTLAALVGELAAMEIMDAARVELLRHYRLERF